MVSREKILKVDILTPSGTRILSANAKQFSIPSHTNSQTGRLENVLIVKGRRIPEIETGCDVDIIAYMRSGERIKYIGNVAVSTDMQLNVILRIDHPQIMEERRRYFKVPANIACLIENITRSGEPQKLEVPSCARIQDFNIGGVFLCVSDTNLCPADVITISLVLINDPVEVCAEVLRVQKNPAGDTVGYGCRFVDINPALEETFAKFVYQAQLDAIKKNGIQKTDY